MALLNVILIGVTDKVWPAVKQTLSNELAEILGQYSNVRQALTNCAKPDLTGAVVIIQMGTTTDLDGLAELALEYPTSPVLALLDGEMDVPTVLAVNRAGASQMVTIPIVDIDFRDALRRLAGLLGKKQKPTRVVAVNGATGGCGATTLAINLAYETASQFKVPTLLVELSANKGVLASYLDIQPQVNLRSLIEAGNRLDAYMVKQSLTEMGENLWVLTGPDRMTNGQIPVSAESLLRIIDYCRKLAEIVILDVPCTYNDLQMDVLNNSDFVMLVGEQTVPSVRSMQLLRETLSSAKPPESVRLVLNRYNSQTEGFSSADLQSLLGSRKIFTVAQDIPVVTAAINQGKSLRQISAFSPALASIHALAREIVDKDTIAIPNSNGIKGSGLFRRLMGTLKG